MRVLGQMCFSANRLLSTGLCDSCQRLSVNRLLYSRSLCMSSITNSKQISFVKNTAAFGSLFQRRTSSTSQDQEEVKSGPTPLVQKESLTHFRQSQTASENPKSDPGTDDSTAAMSPPVSKDAVHPDVEEALGMHEGGYRLPHPVWSAEELESVRITHQPPVTRTDKVAYYSVMTFRKAFDLFSGFTWGKYRGTLHEKQWLKRIIFLETVAGVPGMVGAMVRHLVSLRKMKRDHGWIHTLLEEAENERMHLMTAMRVANPGILLRSFIALGQGVFVTCFSVAYLISPTFCHRFVGYLEEEAVKTYTSCLEAIDTGELKMWCRMKAPELAVEYWKLPSDAMMRDVILAIRADEAHHRTVNHTLGGKKSDDKNPYGPGE